MLSTICLAQEKTAVEVAEELYSVGKYREALAAYSALEKKGLNEYQHIANCHYYLREYTNAEAELSKIIDVDSVSSESVLHYAEVLISQKKYAQALMVLERYSDMPEAKDVSILKQTCQWAPEHSKDKPMHEVFVTNIETGGRSLGMALTQTGAFYAVPQEEDSQTKTVYYDLAFANMTDTLNFSEPTELSKDLRTKYYEGSPSITEDGKWLYFTSNTSKKDEVNVKKKAKNKISDSGVNVLKIIQAQLINGEWSNITELPVNNIQYSCTHPSISPDGKTMYFVSNMPGGQGGYDIYRITQNGIGTWSKPLNLGPKVNTAGNEMFPHFFNGSLYFASNGAVGLGGFDIYTSKLEEDGFSKMENIGPGLNSSKDDFAVLFRNDESGYVSSNRDGDNGYDRIYYFLEINYPFTINALVVDKVSTKAIEGAKVEVTFASGKQWTEKFSDEKGQLSFELYPKTSYKITFSKDGYEPQVIDVPAGTPKDSIIAKLGNIEMGIEVKKDVVINLDNIYFGLAQAEPLPESLPILDRLVKLMQEHPEARIELSAHTDCRGGDAYNRDLSDKRAKACSEYLRQAGIDIKRIVPIGYGESRLLNKCADGVFCDEDLHQKNRRVEIKIL
ncbi:MAG: PD40 domain-containing protein [Flavobacteriales bacterium]|nr:PD40 domain-containing protein [Flavobacteriales bacterium]